MSYLVLARKYRPRAFSELVGQDPVVVALSNALASNRLHHAYLFTGTRGVGKTTIARILAKSLNCTGRDGTGTLTPTPCGECPACTQIDAGRFADYIELDAASNRGVEDVQTLLDQAIYKPVSGRYKIFMIDEVHMLSSTAFNAMLKTLEEPPEYLKFVLATTDPKKVPVTVLSRCLQFNLRPLPPATITTQLEKVLCAEAIPFTTSALALLARAARGSMRDALSLTDQAIAFSNKNLELAAVRSMLGVVDKQHAFSLLQAQAQGDGHTLVQAVAQLRTQGYSAYAALDEMTEILLALAVQQYASDAPCNRTGSLASDDTDDARQLSQLGHLLAADETQLLYSMLLQGRQELGLAPDEYAGLTMVLLRFLAFQNPNSNKDCLPQRHENKYSDADNTEHTHPVKTTSLSSKRTPKNTQDDVPIQEFPVEKLDVKESPTPIQESPQLSPQLPDHPPALHSENPGEYPGVTENTQANNLPAQTQDKAHAWWEQTVQCLLADTQITALVRELALQTQCMAQDETQIVLRVAQHTLLNEAAKARLQQKLNTLGIHAALHLELGPVLTNYAKTIQAENEAKVGAAHRQLDNNPLVQALKNEFAARMLSNSIQLTA